MKKCWRNFIAFCLTFCMCCSLLSGVCVFAANEDNVYEGIHSLQVETRVTDGFVFMGQTVSNLELNTDYTATFVAKGNPGNFQVMQTNWSTKILQKSVDSNEWKQFTFDFNTGSNSELLVGFTNNPFAKKNGFLYVDNVSLCKKGENKNLLVNSDFEDGETQWSPWNNIFSLVTSDQVVSPGDPLPTAAPTAVPTATAAATSNPEGSDENIPFVYEGYNSLKMHAEGLGNGEKYVFFTQYVKNLELNTDYVVKFYAKGKSGTYRMLNASNWQAYTKVETIGGGDWKAYTYEFSSGNQSTLILAFTANPYGGKGDIYIDQVSVCKKGDSANLLKNPGFEEGETEWGKWEYPVSLVRSSKHMTDGKVTDGSEPPVETEEVVIEEAAKGNSSVDMYVGPYSLVFDSDGGNREGKVTQNVAVEKNTEYIAMLFVKNPDGIQADFDITGSAGTSLLDGGAVSIAKDGNWKRLMVNFNTGDSTTACFTISATANVEGRICFDNGSLIGKYKPVTQSKATELLLNTGFDEKENDWKGVTEPFSIHYDNEGKGGDISGGVRVMCVGDSITAGVGAVEHKGGYKYMLFEDYQQDGANVNFVGPSGLGEEYGKGSGHAGYSGWRIDQIASNIEAWMYNYAPQVILLKIGTNDILQDKEGNNLYAGAPERMEALIDQILEINPEIKLYVATITPLNNTDNEKKVKGYNEFLTSMVPTKGENVKLVNIHDALTMSDISNDNVHPNDSGYEKIAQAWFDATHETIKGMQPSDFLPDKGIAHSGTGAIQYTPYLVPWYTLLKYESTFQYVNVEKNTDYKVRYWIKGDQGLSLQVRIQRAPNWSWGEQITSNTSSCGPKWMQVEFTFNSGESNVILLNMVNSCMTKGTMYIDDIAVWKADDPTEENLLINGDCETDEKWPQVSPFSLVKMSESDIVRDNLVIAKDGSPLTSLEAGTLHVSADLTDTELSGSLIAAVYQDGVLVDYSISTPGTGELSTDIVIESVDENTELKVMIWDSMDSMAPQIDVVQMTA